ncbi:glycosyltransferase family 2 protein [Egbenema bharatensis]|uniref:glycosyltransferase family 2 protein n=1 Tax=Egbenema bharatensis TaxID=3463334 RepID=UPI003A8B384B
MDNSVRDNGAVEHSNQQASKPIVSFGIPVRNGEKFLPRLFESFLAQDFENFEVVIGDNLSDDRTEEICREYARRDARIKYFRHPKNLGQSGNFNRVFELSQGKYFRWIGDDDWLEPAYTRKCVEFLDSHPNFMAVTTEQDHELPDGTLYYREFKGKRLDSPHTYERFCRMVWFMTADYGFIDPIYTMYRREAILSTSGMRLVAAQDHVLAAELCLAGPFGHIPELLAHRYRPQRDVAAWEKTHKHYEMDNSNVLAKINTEATFDMWEIINAVPMPVWQKWLCAFAILRYVRCVVLSQVYGRLRARVRMRTRLRLALGKA